METEREHLLARLKKEIKSLMEESVTKKFIHEDSASVASLCIVLEQCLVHGFKKPGVTISSLPNSLILLSNLSKHDDIASDTLKRASSASSLSKANSTDDLGKCKSKSLVAHTPRYNWIRIALVEKTILSIVTCLINHCNKLYLEDSLIRNPVTGNLFMDLLSGLIALDYSKTKTPDYYWSDPPAMELLQRQDAKGIYHPKNSKHSSSLSICPPAAMNYVTDHDSSSCQARSLVASLYQSSHSVLLFGKNNVTVQKPDGALQTGYIALHHSGKNFFIKWMSNRFVQHNSDPSFYWDYSWVVYLDEVAYIHAHPYEKEGSIVFIGHDGVQRPSVQFPSQTSLLDFLTCLESGLLSENLSMEPRVQVYLTPNGTFPPKSDKRKGNKQPSFYVFQIITTLEELDEARVLTRKRDIHDSNQSLNSDTMKSGKKAKEGSATSASDDTVSLNSDVDQTNFHLPTRIGEVCQTMRHQILSRAFYGWLAYCRHLTEVRKYLSKMVYKSQDISMYKDLEKGVTKEVWQSLHDEHAVVSDEKKLMFYTYHGCVDADIRSEVWRYLLGHYRFGDTPQRRNQRDEDIKNEYKQQISAWEKVELYIITHDKSKFTPVKDESFSEVVNNTAEKTASVAASNNSDVLDSPFDTDNESYHSIDEEVLKDEVNDVTEPNSISHTVVIDGVEYSNEFIATIDLNFHRIDKDVQRCDRNYYYFCDSQNENLAKLRRIMCTYIWETIDIGYCQGMCDILAPILVVLDDEYQAYNCFKNLMLRMNMNFPHGGIMDTNFANMRSLIQILDSELFDHMHQNIGDYTHFYFSYRWFLLDFKRELEYSDVFKVWEVIWAAQFCASDHFTHFIALALVEHYRDIILDNKMDFTDILKFFNEMAEKHDGHKILISSRQLVHRLQKLIDS